jgi:protein phosphatase
MSARNSIDHAALTDLGKGREVNEDRYYVKCLDDQTLLMGVVDGMGGGPAGSAAAETVRQALASFEACSPHPEQTLADLLIAASDAIQEFAQGHTTLEGMGATVTATFLSNGAAHWAHVGDTRFYVFRRGVLIQVTVDQNMAQLLVDEGRITPDQARTHPYGSLLDQCVGCPDCEPMTGTFPIEKGDLLLHSTDGLHDALSVRQLTDILSSLHRSAEDKARSLVQAALEAGGADNITVIVAQG